MSSGDTLTCHRGNATKAYPSFRSPWPRFSLRSFSTKDGGLHVPCTKSSTPLHTKPEGRRLAGEPAKLKGWAAHQDIRMVHSRTTAQGSKSCLITHSRANLALTLTKLVLRTKDLIFMLLDGLEMFLGVCGKFSNSSKLQMTGGAHIYRPPTRTSR